MCRPSLWLCSAWVLLCLFVGSVFWLSSFQPAPVHGSMNKAGQHSFQVSVIQCNGFIAQEEAGQSASSPWYPQGSSPGPTHQYSQFSEQTGITNYNGATLPFFDHVPSGVSVLQQSYPANCDGISMLTAATSSIQQHASNQRTMVAWDTSVYYDSSFLSLFNHNQKPSWQLQQGSIEVYIPSALSHAAQHVRYNVWSTTAPGQFSYATLPLYAFPSSGALHWVARVGTDVNQRSGSVNLTADQQLGANWYQLGTFTLSQNHGPGRRMNSGNIPAGAIGLLVTAEDEDTNSVIMVAGAMRFDYAFSNFPAEVG